MLFGGRKRQDEVRRPGIRGILNVEDQDNLGRRCIGILTLLEQAKDSSDRHPC
jgi:hypothetical protein